MWDFWFAISFPETIAKVHNSGMKQLHLMHLFLADLCLELKGSCSSIKLSMQFHLSSDLEIWLKDFKYLLNSQLLSPSMWWFLCHFGSGRILLLACTSGLVMIGSGTGKTVENLLSTGICLSIIYIIDVYIALTFARVWLQLYLPLSHYLTRDLDDGYYEMNCSLKISAKILEHEHPIPYKYVIHSPKTRESQDDCYEYLHGHHLADPNRSLKIPKAKYQQACGGMFLCYRQFHVFLS